MELLGHRVIICLALREHQIIFQSSDTNFYFHPQCLRDPVSPHLCQPWYCQSFLFCSSGGCEVVLICISLITKGLVCLFIDHLDMVFCDMPIRFFCPFLFSVVCLIDSQHTYNILRILYLCPKKSQANILSHSVACLFTLLVVFWVKRNSYI